MKRNDPNQFVSELLFFEGPFKSTYKNVWNFREVMHCQALYVNFWLVSFSIIGF